MLTLCSSLQNYGACMGSAFTHSAERLSAILELFFYLFWIEGYTIIDSCIFCCDMFLSFVNILSIIIQLFVNFPFLCCRRYKDKKEEATEPEADPERDQRTVFAYQVKQVLWCFDYILFLRLLYFSGF